VNVGPIVRALHFLTEGRGDDRGLDEAGNPLPDLLSLAFDVIESIVLGGRKAEYFRNVKRELDAQGPAVHRSSLSLAKQALRVERPEVATALDDAADTLQQLLQRASELVLDPTQAEALAQSLDAFRAFGADRWVSATAHLLLAASALGATNTAKPARRTRKKPSARLRTKDSRRDAPSPERAAAKSTRRRAKAASAVRASEPRSEKARKASSTNEAPQPRSARPAKRSRRTKARPLPKKRRAKAG